MKLDAELLAYLADERQITARRDIPLSGLSTLRIGGNADLVLSPHDVASFLRLLDLLSSSGVPFRVLGCGSNVLFSDSGFSGVIVLTSRLDRLSVSDRILRVGAGVRLSRAVNAAREAGLFGLEGLYGIPGSIGGALAMNAGAFGCEISSCLSFATLYDPAACRVFVAGADEIGFGYRTSGIAKRNLIVVSAALQLMPGDRERIGKRMRDVVRRRAECQPIGYPSAGCVFKKAADGRSAGELIESVGKKGRRIGDAAVSDRHANFIVNLGNASARDFLSLAEELRLSVLKERGVELEYEIERIGDFI